MNGPARFSLDTWLMVMPGGYALGFAQLLDGQDDEADMIDHPVDGSGSTPSRP